MSQNKLFSVLMILVIAVFVMTGFKHTSLKDDKIVIEIEQFTSVPSFSNRLTYEENVQSFYNFLKPIIKSENSYIMRDRIKLTQLIDKFDKGTISTEEINWINSKAAYYKLTNFSHTSKDDLSYLLTRIDIIPEIIVMSQAAIESAFGTSGFATKANNLFGMRTLSPSKGIIPKRRATGMRFYVAKYETVNKSIQSYMRNLNTHKAYGEMRRQRKIFRNKNQPIDPYKLVDGLSKYSTEGKVYVQKIRRTMKKHENLMLSNSISRI